MPIEPGIGESVRDLSEIDFSKPVEITMVESDFRIDPLPDDHRQEVRTEAIEWDMNLDSSQYLAHILTRRCHRYAPFTTGAHCSTMAISDGITIDRNIVICY